MGIIVRQGIKNNIITYIGVAIGFINILIVQPLVLQPDELGLLRLLYSVSVLFVSIYPLGLNSFTIKYFPYMRNSEKGHNGYLGFAILSTTILFILGSIIFYLFKPYFLSKYANSALFIKEFNYVFPLSYFLGLFGVLTSYSMSLFKTTFPSFLNDIVIRVFTLSALGLYFIKLINFETLVVIYTFSFLIIVLWLLAYFKYTNTFNLKINWNIFSTISIKDAINFSLIMSITTIASISLRNIDAVFIGSYRNLSEVAVYTIALTIASMIDVPTSALAKIVIPKLAEAFKDDNSEKVKSLFYKSTRISLIAGSCLFLLVYVNAFEILNLLPKKYIEGVWVLKIIAIGGLVNTATGLNLNLIQFSKKYIFVTVSLVSLALLSALSNIILIPKWGLIGAASGTAFSIIIVNAFTFIYIYKVFKLQPFRRSDTIIFFIVVIFIILDFLIPKFGNDYISIGIKSIVILIVFLLLTIKTKLLQMINNGLIL